MSVTVTSLPSASVSSTGSAGFGLSVTGSTSSSLSTLTTPSLARGSTVLAPDSSSLSFPACGESQLAHPLTSATTHAKLASHVATLLITFLLPDARFR